MSRYDITRSMVPKQISYLKNSVASNRRYQLIAFKKYIFLAQVCLGFIFLGQESFLTNVSTSISLCTNSSESRFPSNETFTKLRVIGCLSDAPDYIYCLVMIFLQTVCLCQRSDANNSQLLIHIFVIQRYKKLTEFD